MSDFTEGREDCRCGHVGADGSGCGRAGDFYAPDGRCYCAEHAAGLPEDEREGLTPMGM